MPIFDVNGKLFRVKENDVVAFGKANPEAVTKLVAGNEEWEVAAKDFESFSGEHQDYAYLNENGKPGRWDHPMNEIIPQAKDIQPGDPGFGVLNTEESVPQRGQEPKVTPREAIRKQVGEYYAQAEDDMLGGVLAKDATHAATYNALQKAQNTIGISDNNRDGMSAPGRTLSAFWNTLTQDPIGVNALMDNAKIAKVASKIGEDGSGYDELSEEEQRLMDAVVLKTAAEQHFGADANIADNIGSMTAESIPFMMQMFLTKGVYGGASKATQAGLKGVAAKLSAKFGAATANATQGIGGALAGTAARTPLMTQMWSDAFARMTGTPTPDITPEGVKVGAIEDREHPLAAIGKGFVSGFNENLSEQFGEAMPFIGKAVKSNGITKFLGGMSDKYASDFLKQVDKLPISESFKKLRPGFDVVNKIAKDAGFHGVPSEAIEEYFNLGLDQITLREQDPKEFFSKESQLTMLGSFALTGGALSGMNLGVNAVQKYGITRGYKNAWKDLSNLGFSQEAIEGLNDNISKMTPKEVMANLYDFMDNPEYTFEEKHATRMFTLQALRYNAMKAANTGAIEEKADQAAQQVVSQANPDTGLITYVKVAGEESPVKLVGNNIPQKEDGTPDWNAVTGPVYVEYPDGTRKQLQPRLVEQILSSEDVTAAAEMARQQEAARLEQQEAELAEGQSFEIGTPVRFLREGGVVETEVEGFTPEGGIILTGVAMPISKGALIQAINEQKDSEAQPAQQLETEPQQETELQPQAQATDETQQEPAQAEQAEAAEPEISDDEFMAVFPKDKKGDFLFEEAKATDTVRALSISGDNDLDWAIQRADAVISEKQKALAKLVDKDGKQKMVGDINKNVKNKLAIKQIGQSIDYWNTVRGQIVANMGEVDNDLNEIKAEAQAESVLTAPVPKRSRFQGETDEELSVSVQQEVAVPDFSLDKSEDARKRGYRIVNGERVDRQEPIPSVTGRESQALFSTEKQDKIPVKSAVVDASMVQQSHNSDQRNPLHFISEGQPKDRADNVSRSAAEGIAREINPQLITSSDTAYNGSPIVNARGEVIQGNNRTAAIKKMYESFPEQAAKYKAYLIENAEAFGLDRESIEQMDAPILVRIADVDDKEAIRLGQKSASDMESGGSQRIDPARAMHQLGDDAKSFSTMLFDSPDEAEETLSEVVRSNGRTALKFLRAKNIINDTQMASSFDAKGNITPEAAEDLIGITRQILFKGGNDNLEKMFRSVPDKAKKAILQTIFRDKKQEITPILQEAIEVYYMLSLQKDFNEAKSEQEVSVAIDAWLFHSNIDFSSGAFIPVDRYSDSAIRVAASFKTFKQKTLVSMFNGVYDLIHGEGSSLFGASRKMSVEEAIVEYFKFAINDKRKRTGSSAPNDGQAIQGGEQRTAGPDGIIGRGSGETQPTDIGRSNAAGAQQDDAKERSGSGEQPAVGNDFDFSGMFNQSDGDNGLDNEDDTEAILEQQYQKSAFSKEWAPTRKIAIQKLLDAIKKAEETIVDWSARQYKSSGGKTAEVGKDNDFESREVSVDSINEKRRRSAIRNAEEDIEQAKKDLLQLGYKLPEQPAAEPTELQGKSISEIAKEVAQRQKEEKKAFVAPKTVRELYDLDAEDRSGYGSAIVLNSLNLGDTIIIGGKKYTVTRKTKPSKEVGVTTKGSSYERMVYGLTLTDEKGRKVTGKSWDNYILDGKRMSSTWLPGNGWESLSRDIDGDVSIDLINEYNRMRDTSDSFKRIQKYLDDEASQKPKRFEEGKKLTAKEKKEVLATMKDSYKEMNRERSLETTPDGNERLVWKGEAGDYMAVSDITGRKIRWYITMPDGKMAHPTELYPDLTDAEINAEAASFEYHAQQYASNYKKGSKLLEVVKDKVISQLEKALNAGLTWVKTYDGADVAKQNPDTRLRTKAVTKFEPNGMVMSVKDYMGINDMEIPDLHMFDWERYYNDNKGNAQPVSDGEAEDAKPATNEQEASRKAATPNQPPTSKRLADLQSQLEAKKKERNRKAAEINSRNGMFGDTKQDPNQADIFNNTFAPEAGQSVIDGIDAEITRLKADIEQEKKVIETAAKENKGQGSMFEEQAEGKQPEGNKQEYRYKMVLRPFNIGTYPADGFVKAENDPDGGYQILTYNRRLLIKEMKHWSFTPITEVEAIKGKEFVDKDGYYGKIVLKWSPDNRIADVYSYDTDGELVEERPAMLTAADVLQNIEDGYWIEKTSDNGSAGEQEKKQPEPIKPSASLFETAKAVTEAVRNQEITTENEHEIIGAAEQAQESGSEQQEIGEEDALEDNEGGGTLEALQDFGEKIGAARKDTAQRGYKLSPSNIPGWAKKYNITQNTQTGIWSISIPQGTWFKKLKDGFKTAEEAWESLPLVAVSQNHRVYSDKDGKWSIYRKWSSGKQWEIKGGFETRDEAMLYMAENAVDIINKRAPVIERPHLDKVSRKRKDWRNGKNVTPEQFLDTFGFRGGEFGNWLTSDERQSVLNMSYDAFMDMAEILGISPKALSLKGELSIGFGSRGHGLQGAAAHYEPTRAVINLTRINGAGSLAHEWFHALDNYLAKLDGKSTSKRQEDGTFKQEDRKFAYFSHGQSLRPKTKVRDELLQAFNALMGEIQSREAVKEYDIPRIEKQLGSAREDFEQRIAEVRDKGYRAITRTREYGQKKKPATPEQLKRFDELVDKIRKGEIGMDKWYPSARSRMKGKWMYETEKELSDLVTEITGKAPTSGYGSDNYGFIYSAINRIKRAELELAKAKEEGQYASRISSMFRNEAVEADKSRSGAYWSTPHEMAARAFEAFLEDETLRTGESQYLVYGARNIFYAMFGIKPYPEGQERVNINNAFRKLFDTIQERTEGDKQVLFRDGDSLPATITINGIERPTTNSQGEPIASDIEGVKAFWKWFGDSKVVDNEGRPMVLYHGTDIKGIEELRANDAQGWGRGVYFTDNEEDAQEFGEYINSCYVRLKKPVDGNNVAQYQSEIEGTSIWKKEMEKVRKEVEAKGMEYNEMDVDFLDYTSNAEGFRVINNAFRELGYDGIISDNSNNIQGKEIVAFDSSSIKSATENTGSFDSENDDIRFRMLGEVGAANLDAAEEASIRMDNLAIAKEMESSGKDAKAIRLATGWEIGADGKWRYEVEDNIKVEARNAARRRNLTDKQRRETLLSETEDVAREDQVFIRSAIADYANIPSNQMSEHKQKQLEIILQSNPMADSYHVGIRGISDIKTFEEAADDPESFVWGDFSKEDAKKALKSGSVTVYSSTPIANGVFVSTSKNQAKDYAGDGKVHEMKVPISDVAWINGDQGQYARVEDSERFRKTTPTGFYSTVEEALNSIKQEKGTADQMKAMLLKNGAKQAEMDWMGWEDQFPDATKKITKADIQDWIDENRIEVEEVQKGGFEWKGNDLIVGGEVVANLIHNEDGTWSYQSDFSEGEEAWETKLDAQKEAEEAIIGDAYSPNDTKFSDYTLPGGKNYKELLLTMPTVQGSPKGELEFMKSKNIGINSVSDFRGLPDERQTELMNEYRDYTESFAEAKRNSFKSSHFDEPNILAHIRFNEREIDGKRVLFIEEIQSDWAQKGKKEGFKSDNRKAITESLRKEKDNFYTKLNESEDKQVEYGLSQFESGKINREQLDKILLANGYSEYDLKSAVEKNSVPDMPFKLTPQWTRLALRRMLRYAVDNGFDQIAWTNGEMQAERYDLSKQLNKVDWHWENEPSEIWISAYDKQNKKVINNQLVEGKLDEVVGKDLADKIKTDIENGKEEGAYSGLDLKVGGEGMKAFYDQIIQKEMREVIKPFSGKLTTIEVEKAPVQAVEINEQMKEVVPQGLPLYRDTTPKTSSEQAIEQEAQKMADSLPEADVEIITSPAQITDSNPKMQARKRAAKGWYNPKTGKITVVAYNHESVADVQATILHEVVAHHGLRGLLGDQFNAFLAKVWDSMPASEQSKYLAKYGNKREAAEEYIAAFAENGVDTSLFERVAAIFRAALRKVGIRLQLGEKDIMYTLWLSKNRLTSGTSAIKAAKQIRDGVRFREAAEVERNETKIKDTYDRLLTTKWHRLTEAHQNNMESARKVIEQYEKASGKKVQDHENFYLAENAMSSKSTHEMEVFDRDYFKPIITAIAAIIEQRKGVSKVVARKEATLYMLAKHGIERNEKMNEKKETEGVDYSALEAVNEAIQALGYEGYEAFIAQFEQKHNTAALWKAINAATKKSLRKWYESGLMSKVAHDEVAQMYKNYIPLRGFESKTAEDVYDYLENRGEGVNSIMKTAKGRKSLPDDPIAHIASMAESAVMVGNRNAMKMHLMRFAQNHKTDLVRIAKVWYVNNGTKEKPVWEEEFPAYDEDPDVFSGNVDRFEAEMKEMEEAGMARKDRTGLSVGRIILKKAHREEHMIRVSVNGRDNIMYVMGNPRLAQAINGKLNPDTEVDGGLRRTQAANRQLSANFTSRNPAFVVSNFFRDWTMALTIAGVSESPSYVLNQQSAILGAAKALKHYQKTGQFPGGEMGSMLREFLENGGRTGYTSVHDMEQHKRIIKTELNRADGSFDVLKGARVTARLFEDMNRVVEDINRLATYVASRKAGRSVAKSIADAKNITLNFNRRGSGEMGNKYLRAWFLFVNPAIQSLNNLYERGKVNPIRMGAAIGAYAALGMMVGSGLSEVVSMLLGDDEEKKSGYDDLPEWVRRNNFCIEVGGHFLTIPLAQEFRPFYAVGEIIAQAVRGNMKDRNIGLEIASVLGQILPFDLVEVGGAAVFGDSKDLALAFAPDALKPIAQVWFNQDFFGIPIQKERYGNNNTPSWRLAYSGTNQSLVSATKLLNEATGGDYATKGWANVVLNPATIEHLFEGYLGGMGKTVNQTAKLIGAGVELATTGKTDLETRNIPVLNRLISTASAKGSFGLINDRYYKLLDKDEKLSGQKRDYANIAEGSIKGESPVKAAQKLKDLVSSPEWRERELIHAYRLAIEKQSKLMKDARNEEAADQIRESIMMLKQSLIDEVDKLSEGPE